MSDLLEVSENSYFRWKAKDHTALIELIERYFDDSDIEEFMRSGKIQRLDFPYKLSLIQFKSLSTHQSINVGLILYLDKRLEDCKVYFPSNIQAISDTLSISEDTPFLKEACSTKSKESIEKLPSPFSITVQFDVDSGFFSKEKLNIETLFNDLVDSYISIESFKDKTTKPEQNNIKMDLKPSKYRVLLKNNHKTLCDVVVSLDEIIPLLNKHIKHNDIHPASIFEDVKSVGVASCWCGTIGLGYDIKEVEDDI